MDNGLTFSIPRAEEYSIENAPNGARIRPANWRSMRELSEVIVEVKDSPPAGDFNLQKSIGGRHIKYRIDAADGGSGGEERTLNGYVEASGHVIIVRQLVQSEMPSDNDFDLAWAIISSAQISRP